MLVRLSTFLLILSFSLVLGACDDSSSSTASDTADLNDAADGSQNDSSQDLDATEEVLADGSETIDSDVLGEDGLDESSAEDADSFDSSSVDTPDQTVEDQSQEDSVEDLSAEDIENPDIDEELIRGSAFVSAGSCDDHRDSAESYWSSAEEFAIDLSNASSTSEAVQFADGTVTISAGGTYRLSGQLSGQVLVESDDDAMLRLILDGVDIQSSSTAAINILDADRSVIYLEAGSNNSLEDGATRDDADEANATLYCKSDLSIEGSGSLAVIANHNDGITGKDGLVLVAGDITIEAEDDGLRGKDYLTLLGGQVVVNSTGDGFTSDNEDEGKGVICSQGGAFDIDAEGDGAVGANQLALSGGSFVIRSGGGHTAYLSADASAKGLKAGMAIEIDGGSFEIDAADDAIHSDVDLEIAGGTFVINTGDDGVHAEETLTISDGVISVEDCYEGVEALTIVISGGETYVVADDDGLNGAGGMDSSGGWGGPPPGGSDGAMLTISGGLVVIDAGGDGVDCNGDIVMTGGEVYVHGPTNDGNGPLDYDESFEISGGVFIAVGSAGMAQAPSYGSSQYAVLVGVNGSAGSLIHLERTDGTELFTFRAAKSFESVLYSSPELSTGSYSLYTGGSSSGAEAESGLIVGGSYSPGSLQKSFSISSIITTVDIQTHSFP